MRHSYNLQSRKCGNKTWATHQPGCTELGTIEARVTDLFWRARVSEQPTGREFRIVLRKGDSITVVKEY